ncbi:MAG: lipoyl(octanoyl) transferase [Bacteroidetes bacterium RIFOXYA12_FULL_35_11]|nr:MAG: lipoyl(octanoyl) transferase [Bacteroidetes bacterium GWF2_35_48]OFY80184.1 MAG: lipoyl(octanoyl) transferase [Bacteroidetes bacterium RIFOXYA12_FULL_35_11]OFY93516.1 MAG: lipoyl(octanoyl) transferase [Bacteroidetes bacterium RIFOXYC12_FULL_35_7]OFY96809.1 MAG: lipoyl(octanoyl) transferase [Bacteroidetes bacterium RIFOXYB2_FULL_35_7]HBX51737.1 lipoate--protein ligase [Bacteroidales bacterium]
MEAVFQDLELMDYKEAWVYQEDIFNKIIDFKLNKISSSTPGYLLFVEHPHVYTLGKNGKKNNLLINDSFLEKIQASFYEIDRGGDITYHGPGQLVGYPVIDIELAGLTLKKYIFLVEEAIIQMLAGYEISAERLNGATGVWLDVINPAKIRKICAIGVRASRYVTMHGFALNVNTDLKYFSYINPCGFIDKGITSMEKELGEKIDMQEVKQNLKKNLADTLFLKFK